MINLRLKTVDAGNNLANGINYSLAALRGYMILGSDPEKAKVMKAQRQEAWDIIKKSTASFETLSSNWTDPANVEKLRELVAILKKFEAAQNEVEAIAQSVENVPSYAMLLNDAAPRASKILAAITAIIDAEAQMPSTQQRKHLLVQLANSRGSFAVGLANIRAYLLSGDIKFKEMFDAKWQANEKALANINNKYIALFSPAQKKSWQMYTSVRQEFSPIPPKMFELRGAANWNQANFLLGTKAAPSAKQASAILKDMQRSQNALMENDLQLLQNSSTLLSSMLIIGAVVSLVISTIVALWFSRDLLSRLNPVLQKALDISDNNLSTPKLIVKGKDEIATLTSAVNNMSNALSRTLETTAHSMQGVSSEANDIYIANTDMSKNIDQQNQQVSLIAAAIEELSASSKEVSDNSKMTAESADSSVATAKQGGNLVNNSLSQMSEISSAFDDSADSIGLLSEQSRNVESILNVIREIAEQTNLLALNAAIEAARAGESGRGFAVVADEVRQLASRTTEATADVEKAIEKMKTDTRTAEKNMEIGRDKVKQGIAISDKLGAMLEEIINSATEVSSKVHSIALSSNEQFQVTVEIASNTNHVSNLSSSVNDGINQVVERTRSVSQSSSDRASELLKMIG